MARIRTIKPEFFRSPDIAQLDYPARQLFQAMWCWADDFGIGETNINGLLGFAFADTDQVWDEDLRRFRAVSAPDVRRMCADLARVLQVSFYEVRGRHYYAIPTWEQHQKLERRNERRQHPPPDDPDATPDLRILGCADSAPILRGMSGAESALEQGKGNRGKGTGEEELPRPTESDVSDPRALEREPDPWLFTEFWGVYPRRVRKEAARKAWRAAVKKHNPDEIVAAAARFARDPNLPDESYVPHPATWLNQGGYRDGPLPVRNRGRPAEATGTSRARAALDRAARYAADPPRQIGAIS